MQEKSEEEDVFLKLWHQAMAEVDFLARKLASAASCDEEELVQEKEQRSRVPLMIEKKDLVGASLSMQGAELKQGSHPYLMQVEVPEVSGLKEDAETMMDRMHSMLEEELGLKEEKVTGVEKDWHELSPLVADKLLPPDREGSMAGTLTSGGNVKYELLLKEEMDLEAEWIKSRPKENFAEAAEQPDIKKLMLRQVNLNIKEVKKHADAKQLTYIMKEEINEVGEVVKMLGKTAQMKMTSKFLKEEVGVVVTRANPEAKEKFKKCDNSFPHEPGAESESSKIKGMKEIDPWAHWIRWRRYGGAECFPRLSKKAEVAEAQTSSKEKKTKSSHSEMKVEKDWQGSVPLVIDKQDQVEVSMSKVEMRLMMHTLKAEAVQFKNTEVKLVEDKLMETLMKLFNVKDEAEQLIELKLKLMEEKLLVFIKLHLELKGCEKERHEALPLLVDKQAADAG